MQNIAGSHRWIAREGWPFILLFAAAAILIQVFLGFWWALPLYVLTAFSINFFRDPARPVSTDPEAVVCPADGKVILVEQTQDPYLKRDAIKISIFMNVFDVHINRMPINGQIRERWYHPGRFFNAALNKASLENERNALWVRTPAGRDVTVVQVAGLVARRILCYVQAGDAVSQGDRFGFIRFGSRVDTFLPLDTEVLVSVGDRVRSRQDVIARLPMADRVNA
ncbi:phosphatidylserine decarboxylase [Thermithiobacillus plumbiphilus]|uniref:Phosphatidylserine decarboxylase proenzyme n=1 Tax=Thermithiobacillus plumbiphilus TaxID=1729899 RepID=A0ABU9D5Y8_9PROT